MKNFARQGLGMIFLLLLSSTAFSQKGFNTHQKDSSNIYYYALTEYVKTLEINRNQSSTIYVEENFAITGGLPKARGHFTIDYITKRTMKRLLRKSNKRLTVLRVIPVQIKGAVVWANVHAYEVVVENEKLSFIKTGGQALTFKFNCNSGELEYLDTIKEAG